MPNCNYGEWLEKSIGSILEQSYKNYEIIFVDDMSTDNSVEIAKRLIKGKGKVIALKQKRYNGGARNEAYLYLSDDTDYVMYLDSDDWFLDKDCLKRINQELYEQPSVLFIPILTFRNNENRILEIPEYENRYQAIQGFSGSCSKVIRKELATRQECLYNEGTLKEDKNHHCKICIAMDTFKCMQTPIYVWNRTNSKSVTTARDNIAWKVSTIRHYADTLELFEKNKNGDKIIRDYLSQRVETTRLEMESGGDRQW